MATKSTKTVAKQNQATLKRISNRAASPPKRGAKTPNKANWMKTTPSTTEQHEEFGTLSDLKGTPTAAKPTKKRGK